jgi:hypothetical protein
LKGVCVCGKPEGPAATSKVDRLEREERAEKEERDEKVASEDEGGTRALALA